MYFAGLFLMTIGIAISVKSNLAVSQITGMVFSNLYIIKRSFVHSCISSSFLIIY